MITGAYSQFIDFLNKGITFAGNAIRVIRRKQNIRPIPPEYLLDQRGFVLRDENNQPIEE